MSTIPAVHEAAKIASMRIKRYRDLMDSAARQRAYKARKRALGLVQVTQVWVHPEDVQRVREYAASLRWAREHYKQAMAGQRAYLESTQAP